MAPNAETTILIKETFIYINNLLSTVLHSDLPVLFIIFIQIENFINLIMLFNNLFDNNFNDLKYKKHVILSISLEC